MQAAASASEPPAASVRAILAGGVALPPLKMGRGDALGVEAVEEACNQGGTRALHALAPCGVLMRCLVKRQVDVVVKGMEARQRVSVATVDGAVRIATSGLEAIAVVTGHLAVAVLQLGGRLHRRGLGLRLGTRRRARR